ncbi:cation transporter [soil metagenome]
MASHDHAHSTDAACDHDHGRHGHSHDLDLDGAPAGFRRVVWLIMILNAAMFVIEVFAGGLSGSMSLQADALDFAADTVTYGLSLFALSQSARFKSHAALIKGASLGLMGAYVLAAALWRAFVAGTPDAVTMGGVGLLALAVNCTAAVLLLKFREGDANIRSVWLCSRNDALGNVAVLAAAAVVALTHTRWADLGVAVIMAGLFTTSSWKITRQALGELRAAPSH